MKFEM